MDGAMVGLSPSVCRLRGDMMPAVIALDCRSLDRGNFGSIKLEDIAYETLRGGHQGIA